MKTFIINGGSPAACTNAVCPVREKCRRPDYSLKEVWPFHYENGGCQGFISKDLTGEITDAYFKRMDEELEKDLGPEDTHVMSGNGVF